MLITPTVISLVDKNQNIAFVLDLEDEESNGKKGKESAKNFEIIFHTIDHAGLLSKNEYKKKESVRFKSKNYTSEFLTTTTPPPEFLS